LSTDGRRISEADCERPGNGGYAANGEEEFAPEIQAVRHGILQDGPDASLEVRTGYARGACQPRSDPPHEWMKPEDRLSHHVNRRGQVVAPPHVGQFMCPQLSATGPEPVAPQFLPAATGRGGECRRRRAARMRHYCKSQRKSTAIIPHIHTLPITGSGPIRLPQENGRRRKWHAELSDEQGQPGLRNCSAPTQLCAGRHRQ
jgi:hypothetical protein